MFKIGDRVTVLAPNDSYEDEDGTIIDYIGDAYEIAMDLGGVLVAAHYDLRGIQ